MKALQLTWTNAAAFVTNIAGVKQQPVFLVLHMEQDILLDDLLSPENPKHETLGDLAKVLKNNVKPEPIVIAER